MSADPAAVEALAELLGWLRVTGEEIRPEHGCMGDPEACQTVCPVPVAEATGPDVVAAQIVGSPWLAARDAAMRAEGASTALLEAAQTWQWGAWIVLTPAMKGKSGPALIIAAAQAATDWLRERADAPHDRTEGDT